MRSYEKSDRKRAGQLKDRTTPGATGTGAGFACCGPDCKPVSQLGLTSLPEWNRMLISAIKG